jgi:hypothetical protein
MNTGPTKKFQLIQKPARNHKKPPTFNRKSTQTAPVFVQNKPKVKSPRIHLTAVITSTYAPMDNWLNAKNKPNQTQFKHKTNPTPKTVLKPYITVPYTRKPPSGGPKNKPNSNPIPKMSVSTCHTAGYIKNTTVRRTKTNPNKPKFTPQR